MNPSIVAALIVAIPSFILMGLILHDEGKHARKGKGKSKRKGKGKGKIKAITKKTKRKTVKI